MKTLDRYRHGRVAEIAPRASRHVVVVVSWNEGDRLRRQLARMSEKAALADILIADGDSTDGSTETSYLKSRGVRALLVTSEPGIGAALELAFSYALEQGYEGVVTIDGNGKDSVEDVPKFLELLDEGYDFVQGSRFMAGGRHENTPLERLLGVRLVVAPILWLGCGYWYSDATNGFKAISRRALVDPRVAPLREELGGFRMQLYLNYRSAKLGLRVCETPVRRSYPASGPIPTKITRLSTKLRFVKALVETALGRFNPA